MSRKELDELKQQIPLLDYLEAHHWRPMRRLSRGRWMGFCPLHDDHQPSFLMDPSKNLFYCYGCGRGGDVIRFAELYHEVQFPQALALLHQWRGGSPLLQEATSFYRRSINTTYRTLTLATGDGPHSACPPTGFRQKVGEGWPTNLGAIREACLQRAGRFLLESPAKADSSLFVLGVPIPNTDVKALQPRWCCARVSVRKAPTRNVGAFCVLFTRSSYPKTL